MHQCTQYRVHDSHPASVVLPLIYEKLLVGCLENNVGNVHEFITAHGGKNGGGHLYIDGVKVIFVYNPIRPWFVLDSVPFLNPDLLEDDEPSGPEVPSVS